QRALLAVQHVAGRVTRDHLQLEQGEAVGGGNGVGPGDVIVEAHLHHGRSHDGGAGDIHLPGDGHVNLVETVDADRVPVGVGQQQAPAGFGGVAAEGDPPPAPPPPPAHPPPPPPPPPLPPP